MRRLGKQVLMLATAVVFAVLVAVAGVHEARTGYVFTPVRGNPTGIDGSETVVGTAGGAGVVWRDGGTTAFTVDRT